MGGGGRYAPGSAKAETEGRRRKKLEKNLRWRSQDTLEKSDPEVRTGENHPSP